MCMPGSKHENIDSQRVLSQEHMSKVICYMYVDHHQLYLQGITHVCSHSCHHSHASFYILPTMNS